MRDFGLASILYIGIQIGIYLVIGLTWAIFQPSVLSNVYINNYITLMVLPFLVLVAAGYIYAVKRNHERMRQIVLKLIMVFAIHLIGSLAWPYIEPLLSQSRG